MLPLNFIIGIMSSAAFSILLMGFIGGYTIGKWVNPRASIQTVASPPPSPIVAQGNIIRPPNPGGGGGCRLQ